MRTALLAAIGAASVLAAPATDTTALTSREVEPCALIASQVEASVRAGPAPYRVDAATALACLKSVPLDIQRNPDLLKAVRATLQFQSTLAFLKNPPPGALYPAVDMLGGIDDMANKLNSSYYKNEYDFQLDLYKLSKSSHDFHVNLWIDITEIFQWRRQTVLTSVSNDGISLPEIYDADDLPALNGKRNYTASPVTKINGINVETWINNYAGLNPLGHDPDANYNNVLYNAPLYNSGRGSGRGTFANTFLPQGAETVLTFANGTNYDRKISNFALTSVNFAGVVDGASFFKKFCNGVGVKTNFTVKGTDADIDADTTTVSSSSRRSTPTTTTSHGLYGTLVSFTPVATQSTGTINSTIFPRPLVITDDTLVAGYLPQDRKDLAVLAMTSFEPANPQAFQNTVRKFLATANSQNRTKLVIDVRGNKGGYIYVGYDTFRQLFPTIMPFGTTQSRSSLLFRDMVTVHTSYYNSTASLSQSNGGSPFNALDSLDINGKPFKSAQALYGPYTNYGDNFTALERANLNKTSYTAPVDVYGFGANTAPVPQVFKAENMVILSDGFCGSTCAVFVEFLKSQGGVKSIVVGGRKQNGPMQAVGGSKGGQVIDLESISRHIGFTKQRANSTTASTLASNLADLIPGMNNLVARSNGGKNVRVNYKNNIRQNDTSLTPLQYVYEAADCRFFYTAKMYIQQSLVWNMAADIHWGNASCVPGSAGHPSSLSGTLGDHLRDYPPIGANYTFEAPDSVFPSGVNNPASAAAGPTGKPSMAASTGATVFDKSTTYISSLTATTMASTTTTSATASTSSSTPSDASTSAQPTNSATRPSAGFGGSAIIGLLVACFL